LPAITFNVGVDGEDGVTAFVFPSEALDVEVVCAVVFWETGVGPGLLAVEFNSSAGFVGWRFAEANVGAGAEGGFTGEFTEVKEAVIGERGTTAAISAWTGEGSGPVGIETKSSEVFVNECVVASRHDS